MKDDDRATRLPTCGVQARPDLPRVFMSSGALCAPTGLSSALLVLGNSRGTAKLRHKGLVVDALADSA
jgi:hypothetical protein